MLLERLRTSFNKARLSTSDSQKRAQQPFVALTAFLAFALLTVAYLCLGLANISNPGTFATNLTKVGGWVLIADGLAAWYLSWGLAVNSVVGERIPLAVDPADLPRRPANFISGLESMPVRFTPSAALNRSTL